MTETTYVEAAVQGLREELKRDDRVWALGEDLGNGGVFAQYRGLQEEFGPERVTDAPISEAAILGGAVGAAMAGMRPVVEMRFSDFALCAVDELVNQAAKARYMFGGQTRVPLVVREPSGLRGSAAAQHSQSLEAWYAHIPGLVVVCPSTPHDVRGLLKASIRSEDPVVFMEHKGLWQMRGQVDLTQEGLEEIGVARTVRKGTDLTIVSWSAQVWVALEAAEHLSHQGIEVEVIDLRSLWPWDKKTVSASVAKTRRLIVTHEAVTVGGFGGEIAAWVTEHCWDVLKGPVVRLGAPRIPVGYAPILEDEVRVTVGDIVERATHMLGNS